MEGGGVEVVVERGGVSERCKEVSAMTSEMLIGLFFRWVRQRGNGMGMAMWIRLGVERSVLSCDPCPYLLNGSHIDPLAAPTAS